MDYVTSMTGSLDLDSLEKKVYFQKWNLPSDMKYFYEVPLMYLY